MQSIEIISAKTLYRNNEQLLKESDTNYEIFKKFKVGFETDVRGLLFKVDLTQALCSGYCKVDEFIDYYFKHGVQECVSKKIDNRGRSYGDTLVTYKKCLLEMYNCKKVERELR